MVLTTFILLYSHYSDDYKEETFLFSEKLPNTAVQCGASERLRFGVSVFAGAGRAWAVTGPDGWRGQLSDAASSLYLSIIFFVFNNMKMGVVKLCTTAS